MSTSHVSVRLDADTIARVDALAPQFSTQWRPATRSDVLRALILSALEGYEEPGPGGAEPPTEAGGRRAKPRGEPR
jgi:hypothetical protein